MRRSSKGCSNSEQPKESSGRKNNTRSERRPQGHQADSDQKHRVDSSFVAVSLCALFQLDPGLPEANVDAWFESMLNTADPSLNDIQRSAAGEGGGKRDNKESVSLFAGAHFSAHACDPLRFALMDTFGSLHSVINSDPEALRIVAPSGASFLTREQAETIKHTANHTPRGAAAREGT